MNAVLKKAGLVAVVIGALVSVTGCFDSEEAARKKAELDKPLRKWGDSGGGFNSSTVHAPPSFQSDPAPSSDKSK